MTMAQMRCGSKFSPVSSSSESGGAGLRRAGKSHNKRGSLARLRQGPQISNSAETFQMEYSVDQIRAFRRVEDGRDEVGGLGDIFVAGHSIFWRAANVVDPLAEVRAIRQS